jgi:hypothetical protein
MKRLIVLASIIVLALIGTLQQGALAALKPLPPRQVICLDGTWQIEQGGTTAPLAAFSHTVAVPGLADMARPAFAEVGRKSPLRQAFWYRRAFRVEGPVPVVAILKIHKAKYGTTVFLNGRLVGEHLPCFTPALLNVKPYLKGDGQSNDLVIRVGADRESLPAGMPTGWDFETYRYIPGIYDSVELILTGAPYVVNVQTVPDLAHKAVRVVAEIQSGSEPCQTTPSIQIDEATGGRRAGAVKMPPMRLAAGQQAKLDVTVPLGNCRLWSPEHPFLYEAKIGLGSDAAKTRFGMRSFRFDPVSKQALLNEKPYFLRGSNVTILRFFEDAARGDLPWRADWVRRLHRKFRDMHWNALRYCIGFPPEFWYDIADEEGLLIQDEFPIWILGGQPAEPGGAYPDKPRAERIIPEYIEWMRERWNHPCVAIWDGQNESSTPESGKAIRAVRHLDLSHRPWENGHGEPQSPTDCIELHPYLFIGVYFGGKMFHLSDLEQTSGVPPFSSAAQAKIPVAKIINEYDWLWLNRDGSPTSLTREVYQKLLGPNSTVRERRMLHARYMAALTEFWRCHRQVAGVLHFCALGYSRPSDKPRPEGGATCDDFIDVKNLVFEPLFERYMRDAFNPVGLMLDFWAAEVPAGGHRSLRVFAINDLDRPWQGAVRLRVLRGEREVSSQTQTAKIARWGREILTFPVAWPKEPGSYTLAAERNDDAGKPVQSLRDVTVK